MRFNVAIAPESVQAQQTVANMHWETAINNQPIKNKRPFVHILYRKKEYVDTLPFNFWSTNL